ncbi:hypothetical protein, partial [Kribbella solani]|uniref:hypothetical protein n=1 Tax=Kribbella solani TaxID=236067 RepID=UPI0029BB9562
ERPLPPLRLDQNPRPDPQESQPSPNFRNGPLEISTPVAVRKECGFRIDVAASLPARHAVAIRSTSDIPPLRLRLEDISPDLSTSADLRIETYANQCWESTLGELVEEVKHLLIEHGRADVDFGEPERQAGQAENLNPK